MDDHSEPKLVKVNVHLPSSVPPARRPWYRILYVQVLIAVALGILVGAIFPEQGKALKPLGDGFVSLIKMIIAPIIFCTVVHGIASMSDFRKLGRLGIKTIVYFEVVSTLALVIGLVVVNVLQPGVGFHATLETIEKASLGRAPTPAPQSITEFVLHIIPKSFFEPFATGNVLQTLFIAILTAIVIALLGERGRPALAMLGQAERIFFGILHLIVRAAPIGAFGAMAYTAGEHGSEAIVPLVSLMLGFYVTAALFVLIVLGSIAKIAGFSIFRFLAFIKEEILLVLGTSSSESALPSLIEKLRRLGCSESTVGFVIPTGYSFNLDGTNIYMTMAAIFLAQATDTPLTLWQQLTLLAVAMLTSKGATGVTGAGFIALGATLDSVHTIPAGAIFLLLGIDRFMSECRSITNLIGNGVATVVLSRSEGELSANELRSALEQRASIKDEETLESESNGEAT